MADTGGPSQQSNSRVFYGEHKTSLLSSLNNDRSDEDSYCDVTLEVEGRKFPAHKCVLGKLSLFFNKMFKSEMREKYATSPVIYGVSVEMFEIIMDFFYTGAIDISEGNVMELLVASDYLQIDAIKRFCVEFLGQQMDKTNCLEMKESGDMFNSSFLSDTADTLAVQNFEEIIHQTQFKELSKDRALAFLKTRDQKACGSKAVYEAGVSWVDHDQSEREEDFIDFFFIVKLHLLPTSYLEDVVANQKLVKESHDCKDHFQKELLYRLKLPSSLLGGSSSSASNGNIVSDSPRLESGARGNVSSSNFYPEESLQNAPPPPLPAHIPNVYTPAHPPLPTRSGSSSSNDLPNSSNRSRHNNHKNNTTRSPSSSSSSHDNDVTVSKELVKMLRHGKYPDIYIDQEGYASVSNILANRKFRKVCGAKTINDVRRVVQSCDKNRFQLSQSHGSLNIRATFGHSIPVILS